MKRLALVGAAVLAALAGPAAFAQSATVVTGGPVILEGPAFSKPIAGGVIAEAPIVAAPGATVAVVPSTNVLGGPAAVVTTTPSSSVTIVRHYWNVPADISSRMDFQRWQHLR